METCCWRGLGPTPQLLYFTRAATALSKAYAALTAQGLASPRNCYRCGKGRAVMEGDGSRVKRRGDRCDWWCQGQRRSAKTQAVSNSHFNSKHPSTTPRRETQVKPQNANGRLGSRARSLTLALWGRFIMVSGLKSFLFFLHRTAVMMMMITVTTAMGASTAAMIHRLFGGFFTTATENCKPASVSLTVQTQDLNCFQHSLQLSPYNN